MSLLDGLLPDIREVAAPAGSINAELLALPQERTHTHDMQGRLLLLPRTGLIVVPYKTNGIGYDVVIVSGDGTYPRGGYNLHVSDLEMQTAVELEPGDVKEEQA